MPRTRTTVAERTLDAAAVNIRILDSFLHDDASPLASAQSTRVDVDVDARDDCDAPSPARAASKRGAAHGAAHGDGNDDDDGDDKVAGDLAGGEDSDDSDDDSDFELVTSTDDDDFDSETDHDTDDVDDDDDDDDVVDDAADGDDDADVDAREDHHHPVDHSQGGDGDGNGDSGVGNGGDDGDGDAPSDDNGAPLVAVHDPVIPCGSGFKLPNEKLRGEASTFVERVAGFIFARSFRFFNYLYVFVGMMFLKVFSDFSVSYACADAMFAVGQVRMRANLCSSHLVRSSRRSA